MDRIAFIVGDTFVYDKVKSTYKVKITDKEEAIKLCNEIKEQVQGYLNG